MHDIALVERAREGDSGAFRALYEAHAERVFRVAYRMAGEEDLARDLTQETFIRAFDRLEQFRGECAFSSWLHRICVSVSLNGLESHRRRRTRETDLETVAEPSAEPEIGLEPQERLRLRRAVDELPGPQRAVVVLHDLEGFTHREIAEILGVAEGTSKARLARARTRLRETLADLDPGRDALVTGDASGGRDEGETGSDGGRAGAREEP